MSRAKGNIAEDRAITFLFDEGYNICDRNFYSRFGEVDIIAMKDEAMHFIEVKSADSYELATQNLTPKKVQRVIKTAHIYMKKNGLDIDFMLDAVVVTPNEVSIIENITI